MTDRELMQQALEALELYQSKSSVQMFDDAVKALRQALETEREWVGLTDEEFKFIASKYSLLTQTGMEYFKDELEAKLKEKNHG